MPILTSLWDWQTTTFEFDWAIDANSHVADEACIGWTGNDRPIRLVYDAVKIIEILIQQGMDETEALEYYDFKIAGAYLGSNTPVIINNWHDDV